MQDALRAELGEVEVLQNEIPVEWRDQAAFKGRLGPQTGDRIPLNPHVGAFEVWHESTLLFSKLKTLTWPNCKQIASNVHGYHQAKAAGSTDTSKYQVAYTHPGKASPRIPSHSSLHSTARTTRSIGCSGGEKAHQSHRNGSASRGDEEDAIDEYGGEERAQGPDGTDRGLPH